MEKINLGDTVKDSITGFTGVVAVRAEWLSGCARISVQSTKLDKEGKPIELVTFDENQLTLVKRAKPEYVDRSVGGPRNDKAALRR